MKEDKNPFYNYIIVGGGSAGCVLAARLSERPSIKVLLVEAGGSDWNPLLHIPLAGGKAVRDVMYGWGLTTEPSPGLNNRRLPWARGKVLGGSSSINGMVYIRGNAADYNELAAAGNRGWSYDDVLPYFKKSERHTSRVDDYHGNDGLMGVSRGSLANPVYDAFIEAGLESGHEHNDDFNGRTQTGFGRYDFTIARGRRQSASVAFLRPAEGRQNLTIVTNALASRIVIENGVARGIEYRRGREKHIADADEIILCGGAAHSPHILMHSGIGDPEVLHSAGIPVVRELPGVGKNLRDHIMIQIRYACSAPVTLHSLTRVDRISVAMAQAVFLRSGPGVTYPCEAGAFTKLTPSEALPEAQWYCFLGSLWNRIRWPGFANSLQQESFALSASLVRLHSVGRVEVKSSEVGDDPLVFPNVFDDTRDLDRMVLFAQQVEELSTRKAFRTLNKGNISGKFRSASEWREWIKANVVTAMHPVGTCKMGHDPDCVVNDRLQVHGVRNLRVADASIFPLVPRGNTNAPTIMVAEKAADFILNGTA